MHFLPTVLFYIKVFFSLFTYYIHITHKKTNNLYRIIRTHTHIKKDLILHPNPDPYTLCDKPPFRYRDSQ